MTQVRMETLTDECTNAMFSATDVQINHGITRTAVATCGVLNSTFYKVLCYRRVVMVNRLVSHYD